MRTFSAFVLFLAVLRPVSAAGEWPRAAFQNPVMREVVGAALDGAAIWLADEKCKRVFDEFVTAEQRRLREQLAELNLSEESFLRMVLFRDGSLMPQCMKGKTLAVTKPGSRVVFVCGRHFEQAWRSSSSLAQAVLIHEMLHTLGLQENPPSSQYITRRVLELCGR